MPFAKSRADFRIVLSNIDFWSCVRPGIRLETADIINKEDVSLEEPVEPDDSDSELRPEELWGSLRFVCKAGMLGEAITSMSRSVVESI